MRTKIERPHYSISQLKCFAKCPYQYYLRYIERMPQVPVYALVSGSAVHAGFEEDNLLLIKGKAQAKPDNIIDKAVAEYDQRLKDVEEEPEFDIDTHRDILVEEITPPVHEYFKTLRMDLINQGIEAAEKEFWTEIAGQPFVGYTDVQTKHLVYDYKLLKRKKSDTQVNFDPQLVVYEAVENLPGAFIQVFRGRKKGGCVCAIPQRSERTKQKIFGWCENTIKCIEGAKKTGNFPRTEPTDWICQNCAFRYKCLGC